MARLTHFNQLADKNGIIAVYPNAMHGRWNIGVRPGTAGGGHAAPRRWAVAGGWGGGGYPGGGGAIPVVAAVVIRAAGRAGVRILDESKNRPEPPDDVAFLNQMLDQLAMKYSVDIHRIYATGLGDGGFMALRVGCSMAIASRRLLAVGAACPRR